jgi:hypothetical protein
VRALCILNAAVPLSLAALCVAVVRDADVAAFALGAFAVAALLLGVASLLAPVLLWRRHGARALLPLGLLFAAVAGSGAAAMAGSRWMLAGTPAMPDTFLGERRQGELGSYAYYLLSEGGSDSIEARLRAEGFQRIEVDSARKVVTLSHAYARTWHDYLYSPSPLGAPYSTRPRLTLRDVPNWRELRFIAQQIDSSTRWRRREPSFHSALALLGMRDALGDSTLRDLAARPFRQRVTGDEKRRVLEALNRQCGVASGLIEAPMITVAAGSTDLRIEGRGLRRGSWAPALLAKLLEVGALARAADGRHLRIRSRLTPIEQGGIEWLQVALMNEIYGELLEARDYVYERQLGEHWYYRRR